MKLTWNFLSALISPILNILAVVVIIHFTNFNYNSFLYFLPVIIFICSMFSVSLFWFLYFYYVKKKIKRKLVISFGNIVLISNRIFLLVLLLTVLLKVFSVFSVYADRLYWLVFSYTFIELIHHSVYKLVYGEKNSLFSLLSKKTHKDFSLPYSGAIGLAIERLKN